MNLRISGYLATLCLLAALAASGAVTAQAALTLAFVAGAALTSYKSNESLISACPSPFEALRIATENLPSTVFRKASQTNVWLGYVPTEEFPKNTGVNQTVFVIGNSEPYTNSEAWTDVTQANNIISTMCSQPYVDVDVGYDEKTYGPRRINLAGPVICRETLGYAHDPGLFIRQYQNELVKRAKRTWEFELRNRAIALYAKAVVGTGFNIVNGGTTFANTASNSQLTQDYLDDTANYLIEVGATDADREWVELGPDGPIFPLIIGNEAAQRLTTNMSDRREDSRFADMGKGPNAALMQRLGASRIIRNFRIVPTVLPPRFNFTMGQYVQVNTYEAVNASEGTVSRVSDDYHNALYEAAFVPHPMAFSRQVIRPDAAGLDWSPINYMGEWVWRTTAEANISDTYCFDPMGNYGRHFANFSYAPKPVYPEFAVALIYKRCPQDSQYAPCEGYY